MQTPLISKRTTLVVMLCVVSFMCGASIFVGIRALVALEKTREKVRAQNLADVQARLMNIGRLGVVQSIAQNHIHIATIPTSATPLQEQFLFLVDTNTELLKRDVIIQDAEIIGLSEYATGRLEDITVGMTVHVILAPEGDRLVAQRIIYGSPFPIP